MRFQRLVVSRTQQAAMLERFLLRTLSHKGLDFREVLTLLCLCSTLSPSQDDFAHIFNLWASIAPHPPPSTGNHWDSIHPINDSYGNKFKPALSGALTTKAEGSDGDTSRINQVPICALSWR